jgi:hypothetical protein
VQGKGMVQGGVRAHQASARRMPPEKPLPPSALPDPNIQPSGTCASPTWNDIKVPARLHIRALHRLHVSSAQQYRRVTLIENLSALSSYGTRAPPASAPRQAHWQVAPDSYTGICEVQPQRTACRVHARRPAQQQDCRQLEQAPPRQVSQLCLGARSGRCTPCSASPPASCWA